MNTEILGFFVATVHVCGYIVYYKSLKNTKTSLTSWAMWSIGSVVNLLTYQSVTGDWVKDLLPLACSLSAIVIFVAILYQKSYKEGDKINFWYVIGDMIALIVLVILQSGFWANVLVQVSTLVSFVPIIRETYKNPSYEKSSQKAWFLWSGAYLLDIILILLRWEKYDDVLYPINCLVLHLIVASLTTRRIQ